MKSVRQHVSAGGRAQFWALMALIVYTPLPLASNRPWAMALLGVLTGCLLMWSIWRPGGYSMDSVWRSARVPLVLLVLWMVLLAVQLIPLPDSWMDVMGQRAVFDQQGGGSISIDPYSTRLYLAKACILSIVFWLVVTLINSRRRIEKLATVIVFSGLLQALLGVLLMASGANFHLFFVEMEYSKAHGTFVSSNQYAGYLELTLAVGIGLMIAKLDGRTSVNWRKRLHGWLALLLSGKAMLRLALIIMVVGLVASRSRMGNSAFFASLLIVGIFAVMFSKHAARTTVVFIVSLIVLDVVIIGGMVGVEKVVQRIQNTNLKTQPTEATLNEAQATDIRLNGNAEPLPVSYTEQSVEERGEAAVPSLQIVRNFPWLGTGGGTFHLAFPHFRPVEVRGYFDHPHNDYVEFASESGLLGFLLLALMVMHSVIQSLKLLICSREQLTVGMAFASLMGIASLLIHGTVDFNFQNPANAMLFLILLSLPYLQTMLKR
jgi:O-antigen ligase